MRSEGSVDDSTRKMLKGIEAPIKLNSDLQQAMKATAPLRELMRQDSISAVATVQKHLQDMGGTPSVLRQIQRDTQQLAQITQPYREMIQAFQPAPWLIEFHRRTTEFAKQIAPAVRAFQEISKGWQQYIEPFQRLVKEIQRTEKYRERMEKAGWLPHSTTPFALLDDTDGEDDAAMLEAYYRDHWPEVKQQFLDRLETHDVDAQAKNIFVAALEAHGHGLYCLVPRALFPEIERVARVELHTDAMAVVTSQQTLREKAKVLTMDDFEPLGFWSYELYKMLNHLYDYCRTPEQKSALEQKIVPNRHAALHGHIVYDTLGSSLNALIMTEFIFQLVTAIKRSEQDLPVAATA